MALTYAEVAEILKVIDASDVEELVLEICDTRLVVRRGGAAGAGDVSAPVPKADQEIRPATSPPPVAAPSSVPGGPPAPVASAPEPGAQAVVAPSVGRAYRRPSPEEPPFVEMGARVAVGQTVCLVEVMKLFTAIEAPCAGTVIAIAYEDGGAVEYGTPLIWIRPD